MTNVIIFENGTGGMALTHVWPAARPETETEAEFLGRVVAEHVPVGSRRVVVDQAQLPQGVPPERWSVDWDSGAITVLPPPPPTAADVTAAYRAFIDAVLQDKRASILSEGLSLSGRVAASLAQGLTPDQVLTPAQRADVAMMHAINAWETALIEQRETAIAALAAGDSVAIPTWITPPHGIEEFLKGY